MRKYFTRRCLLLHVTALVLIPAFLLAGWWQYHCALSGNDLSWAYVVEWPMFAVYAAYIWWQLIHDEHTPFDRFWAAKARVAADATGRPLNQIPGWALDKELSQTVVDSSIEAARALALSPGARAEALESPGRVPAHAVAASYAPLGSGMTMGPSTLRYAPSDAPINDDLVIDVPVVEERVVRDEELDAYNRYLADLAWRDPPKSWSLKQS